MMTGVEVKTAEGELVGRSRIAGAVGISKTILIRCLMAAPPFVRGID